MKGFGVLIAGLAAILLTLAASPVSARTGRVACCRAPAGTVVRVELAEQVSTKTHRAGDSFALRLAEPLIVGDRILLPAGTPGEGVVIAASKPGMGGKPAKLVLAARFLSLRHSQAPLEGLQLAAAGRNNGTAAQVVGLSGIAFGPLGFVGLAVQGGNVTFPPGTSATAKLANTLYLPPIGRATPGQSATAEETAAGAAGEDEPGAAIDIPPPPRGQGQVVFFRRRSLLGTGQWFKVREDGVALGKLTNGAYFVQAAAPGIHTYTATMEPEMKDHLRLEVDAGETYFVEGILTKGVVVGVADLSPSDRAAFDKASGHLKPAPPIAAGAAGLPDHPADTSAAGYLWAKDRIIDEAGGCPAGPANFRAGCLAYVNEATQGELK
jgi:hypothetical protein